MRIRLCQVSKPPESTAFLIFSFSRNRLNRHFFLCTFQTALALFNFDRFILDILVFVAAHSLAKLHRVLDGAGARAEVLALAEEVVFGALFAAARRLALGVLRV